MTDEKNPPEDGVDASSLRWAVAHDPVGVVELSIYEAGVASTAVLSVDEATYLAWTLLSDGGDDSDAAAATRRLAALAGQIVAHRHDDLRPGELSVSHDVVGDPGGGILDRMANGG